ncbi:efflux RND transporter periplasmic adaptor subunit [Heliobacterium mobile]|uniref:efflux RND transporter periplasmic adaptor subunit n=1 Tax=Heliobacterium mobile TaxID=28064 RepID=UPI0014797407|nr:efflux RND transporter periplasmic adaptor subunit [Heliobacterium mobile]
MRTKAAVLVLALSVLATTTACGKTDSTTKSAEAQVSAVSTAPVTREALSVPLVVSGKIAPTQEINVVPKSSGKVAYINGEVGQAVAAGTLLLQLENNDILAKLDSARASLAASQANLDRAKLQLDKNQIQINDAKRNLDRKKTLYDSGATPLTDLETAQTNYDSVQKDYDMNVASVASAQAAVEQNQAAIRQNEVDLENTRVITPISGVISAKNTDIGEFVSTSTAPFVVIDLHTVEVNGSVNEDDLKYIQKGMDVDVMVAAVSGQPFKGKVVRISPAADAKTKTYPIWIAIDNPDGQLKEGMFAEAHFQTQKRENTLVVPTDAVVERGGQKVVYVAEGGKAVERKVTVGITVEKKTEVLDGVKEGELVITSGLQTMRDGMPIRGDKGGNAEADKAANGDPAAQGNPSGRNKGGAGGGQGAQGNRSGQGDSNASGDGNAAGQGKQGSSDGQGAGKPQQQQ